MPQATIFDIDGTLIDSVDLHARAWQEALAKFGHDVTFEQARHQIGKGGDQLVPVFLSEAEQKDHGDALEEWRGKLFKSKYLSMVRPFSAAGTTAPRSGGRTENCGRIVRQEKRVGSLPGHCWHH